MFSRIRYIWIALFGTATLLCEPVLGQQSVISIGAPELGAGWAGTTVSDINPVNTVPKLVISAQTPVLKGAGGQIPLNLVHITPIQANTRIGTVSLSQSRQEIRLLPSDPSKAKSNPVLVHFDIADLKGYAWKAGRYQAELDCSIKNDEGNTPRPLTTSLEVDVAPVMEVRTQPAVIRLHINDAQQYRNGYVSPGFEQLGIVHTVPLDVRISTDAPYFNFTGNDGAANARASVAGLKYQVSGAGTTGSVTLGTSEQQVFINNDIPVGNQTLLQQRFTISAEDLQKYFSEPGTYRSNLSIRIANDPAAPSVIKTVAAQLEVVVDEVMAFDAAKIVDLSIQNMDEYRNGVYSDMYRHLVLTGNITANLLVRSLNANFSSASGSFPVGYLTVGPYLSSGTVRTVQLTTSDQVLIQRYNPNGTVYISLRYSIPANKTQLLVGKPKEKYSATLIYSAVPY